MKKKFKIMIEKKWDERKQQPYKPDAGKMVVMNGRGVFFLVDQSDPYNVIIRELSKEVYRYDVVWKDCL